MAVLRKNSIHRVEISGYTSEGFGVARHDGNVIFVKDAIDGEICDVKILKTRNNVSYAKIESVVTPSPKRISPECEAFRKCGGCTLMHMNYDEELRYKKDMAENALRRIGGCDIGIAEIYGSPDTHHYRNKVIYNIQNDRLSGRPIYGFFRSHSHDVITASGCVIGFEEADGVCRVITEWMRAYGVPAYDLATGKGCIRHVFLRKGFSSGEIQVGIVSRIRDIPSLDKVVCAVLDVCPSVKSIVLNVNEVRGNTVLGGDFYTIYGSDYISDKLLGLEFELSMRSFYQINPVQTERLYEKVADFARLTGDETVLDLYCGTGTITLCLAGKAKKVIGAEIVPQAIDDAKKNARRNGVENSEFICADASHAAEMFAKSDLSPDVITVDPPRKGLRPDVIDNIVKMSPQRVVYVSCDPATLARDIKRFAELGYTAENAVCYDMFPRCSHVESVVLMSRAGS